MPHTDTAVVSYHTHSSPQYNEDDNTSSTIHTHDNLHKNQYHQSPHHTHHQHGHLCDIKTNTRYQNHHYMHNEPKPQNNTSQIYTDHYEDASQFSSASQYNTAETAHINSIYTGPKTNPYKPANNDTTAETTPQGWNINNNHHHSSKPSWGQYQTQHATEQPHQTTGGWEKYNNSTNLKHQNTPQNLSNADSHNKDANSDAHSQLTKTSTVSKSTTTSINTDKSTSTGVTDLIPY